MRSYRFILLAIVVSLVFSQLAQADSAYVGSKKCSECHAEQYADWGATGHHLMMRKAGKAEHANLSLPPSYTWGDISYVIGGVRQEAVFLDQKGYIVTSSKKGRSIKTLYNFKKDTWKDYFPGEKKAYDCAPCHTTGYNPDGHQDDLPGVVGTWEEDGIGCESCHGPGSAHIDHPYKRGIKREPTAAACEECHQHGGISNKPLMQVDLKLHHEQLNELKAGAHKGLSCLNCHKAHKRSSEAKRNCTICHSRLYSKSIQEPHGRLGITCVDCHMPKISKPAISRVSYKGEMRTHIFKINSAANAEMFEVVEEKNRKSLFIKGYITVDFVCLGCHGNRDKAWAAKHAKNFHD